MKKLFQKLAVATALFTGAGAVALADYSPVSYTEGVVAITPGNVVTPLITAVILFFGTIAGLVLLWRLGSMVLRWLASGRKSA